VRPHGCLDTFARDVTDVDRSLAIRNLRKEYRPGAPVLQDISLDIAGRGITAIIGPSGTGKSTLIRCINRLVDPTAGEILFLGRDLAQLSGRPLREARRRIGMVFQEYNLVERLSVIENVLTGRLGYVPVWRAWLRKFLPVTSTAPSGCSTRSVWANLPQAAPIGFPAGSASASASRGR
jgi:ABC-type phosphate/phosphonate transport system ATPase subunit